jgi:riboflavin synthase
MFTGIIESLGEIVKTETVGTNLELWLSCDFTNELKVDQSLAHNGICLTVVEIIDNRYRVTAIDETNQKTTIGSWKEGDKVNLERCVKVGDRLDGHNVQGHVDVVGKCTSSSENDGSWKFTFEYSPKELGHITVPKGSIAVNGVSLTVVDSSKTSFSVAIIPFTYEHTTFQFIENGSLVNLEFDIMGKYVAAYMAALSS